MYKDVIEVRYLEGYKLELVFENGKKGIVDFHILASLFPGQAFCGFLLEHFQFFVIGKGFCLGFFFEAMSIKCLILFQSQRICNFFGHGTGMSKNVTLIELEKRIELGTSITHKNMKEDEDD